MRRAHVLPSTCEGSSDALPLTCEGQHARVAAGEMKARIVLALVGLVCALALGEGVARWRGDRLCSEAPGVVYRADATTGWGRVGNLRGRLGPCERPAIPAAAATSGPDGLLDATPAVPKPADVVRVVLVGGSLSEGVGVLASHRVDAVVEQLADARRGARLEVVNAAVASWALDNDLAWLGAHGAQLAPDLVLVMVDPLTELVSLSPALIAASGQRVPDKPFLTLADGELAPLSPPGALLPASAPQASSSLAAHSALVRALSGAPSRREEPVRWRSVPPPAPVELEAERARTAALAKAILARMRDLTAGFGARLVVVVAPTPLDLRGEGITRAEPIVAAAGELGIPLVDLSPSFDSAVGDGRVVRFPDSASWSGDGHLVAGLALWGALMGQRLLPERVVPATTMLSGVTAPSAAALPALVGGALRDVLDGPVGIFVAAALLAVFVTWMAAPLPPPARDAVMLGLGVALAVVIAGPRGALVGIAGLVAFHQSTRLGGGRALAVQAGLIVALVVGSVPFGPAAAAREMGRERFLVGLATSVLLLRLVALATAWWRGRAPGSLLETLRELLFFPTLVAGPLVTPGGLARLAHPADGVPAVEAGAARLAAGAGLVVVSVVEVALGQWLFWAALPVYDRTTATPLGAWLWLLVAPLTAYLLFAGLTDLGVGLTRLLGLPLARSFRRPFLASTPGDFWRRWLVSFERWLHAHVYLPAGGHGGRSAVAVIVAFVASALWFYWTGLKLVGPSLYPPTAVLGPLAWALVGAAGVLAGRAWRRALPAGGPIGIGLTAVVIALGWPAFFLPAWYGVAELAAFYLRLAGLG